MTRVAEIVDRAALAGVSTPTDPVEIVARARWGRSKFALIEGTQDQPVVVVLNRPLPVAVSVGFVINPFTSTATEGADFVLTLLGSGVEPPFGHLCRIPAGQTTGFFNITAIDDAAVETPEFIDLELQVFEEVIGDYDITIIPNVGQETLRIAFDDAPVAAPGTIFWSFDTDEYFFEEAAPPQTTRLRVNFTAPLPEFVHMRFWTAAGTATPGVTIFTPSADYLEFNRLIAFPPGALSGNVFVRLLNDSESEGAEDFTVHGEVLTPGVLEDGTVTSAVVTINPSDVVVTPLVAYWVSEDPAISMQEGGATRRFRVGLNAQAAQNLIIPVTINVVSGSLSRLFIQWPGGMFGRVVIQTGQFFADIRVTVPYALGVQPTMEYEFEIGSGSGVTPGSPSLLELEVLDAGVILPIVAFRDPVQQPITEGSGAEVFIEIDVTNAGACDLSQGHSIELAYGGAATYGASGGQGDYTIHQLIGGVVVESPNIVNFAPGQTTALIRLRTTNNATSEGNEDYTITLENPLGCELGTIIETTGTIIDDDAPPSGTGILPQFYFASETFGRGPNEVAGDICNMIVDIGPTVVFNEDIEILMAAYSPNATEGVHFDFPDGHTLTVGAGHRYGTLRFRALGPGTATTLRWVVVKMVSAQSTGFPVVTFQVDHYTQHNRWVAVLTGATDDEHLVPPVSTPSTALDDYEVYADRIEDLTTIGAHGPMTILLPYDSTQQTLAAAKYGPEVAALFASGFELYNGVAIAAHLAQVVWLDRNGFSDFGTYREYIAPPNHGAARIQYLEPHVRWLDQGLPVYISVYQQAANGPHVLHFAGDDNSNTIQIAGSICWGRHLTNPNGPVGTPSPSCTRDLYITARSHQHIVKTIECGAVMRREVFPNFPDLSVFWQIGCFTDNIHITGLRFATDPTQTGPGNPLADPKETILGRQPPTYLTKPPLVCGLHYLDSIDWTSTNLNISPVLTFHMRASHPASWIITNCIATRSQRQVFYLDSTGPICILAYNESPVGAGRSLLQLVSRNQWRTHNVGNGPGQVALGGWSAGPSHGLLAVVNNEIVGVNGRCEGADFDIYGHLGQAFFVGNRHRGDVGQSTNPFFNRRIYSFLSSGNDEGMIIADAVIINQAQPFGGPPVLSPQPWFTFRYVEVDKADMAFLGTGQWQNDAVVVTGCYEFVFRTVTAATSLLRPMFNPPFADRSMFSFNYPPSFTLNWSLGGIMADTLDRPILGIGYTLPNPPPPQGQEPNSHKFPNRGGLSNAPPGGVNFIDGFTAAIGLALGSQKLAEHFSFASGFLSGIPFAGPTPTSGLTPQQREDYDGRDPS